MTLDARVADAHGGERQRWRALNDVVLHKGGFARVVAVRVEVDGETIGHFSADGVVISTPTGSTAYNLSAGGPVVYPTLETIIVTPVSAHTLAMRPLVLPATSRSHAAREDGPEELLVTVDGQVGTHLRSRRDARSCAAPSIRCRSSAFRSRASSRRMREKLRWGGLPDRDEPTRC